MDNTTSICFMLIGLALITASLIESMNSSSPILVLGLGLAGLLAFVSPLIESTLQD